MSPGTSETIREEIARSGPIPFERFMDLALYGEAGFYMRPDGGSAGRRGDFITSPEVGPLFGAVLGRYLDAEWERIGRPDPFTVIDAGAGPGTLARSVLAARPACLDAMRYVAVEASPAQRERHPDGIESRPDLPARPDRRRRDRQRAARQPPVPARRVRRRMARGVRRGRPGRSLRRGAVGRHRSGTAVAPAPRVRRRPRAARRAGRGVRRRRPPVDRRRHAGLHRLRGAADRRTRAAPVARVAAHVPDRTSVAVTTSPTRVLRTSPSTSRSTSSPSRTRSGRRRSSCSGGASTNSSPKGCGCGPSRPPDPVSRRCGCAAGSPSRRRCSIPPASAASSSPSGGAPRTVR